MAAPAAPSNPTKVIVAVHGIGDQTAYATIQSVALRLSNYRGRPVATPLGRFYLGHDQSQPGGQAGPQLMLPADGNELKDIVLAEAYWADTPRQVVEKKFILEETKRWARSIAARVAYRGGESTWTNDKVERLVVVLDEMVETIRILERVTYLAEKAGVLKFDLGRLLVNFVGDVQIVADFPSYRQVIVDQFKATMAASLEKVPKSSDAELYIVAHSEGTVVAFLGLLQALANPDRHSWISKVKGLMTIGSPIETHHLLWAGLWRDEFREGRLVPAPGAAKIQIPWENYMDYGDPIAYELTQTTEWLKESKFGDHLSPVTHSFSRYPLPGKAHNDYWDDSEVFDHFFENVVNIPRRTRSPAQAPSEKVTRAVNRVTNAKGTIRSRIWVPTATFVLPYALVAVLMFAAVWALEHAVGAALGQTYGVRQLAFDVSGIGLMIFGITAASRLPRIVDERRYTVLGWAILAGTLLAFGMLATTPTQQVMGGGLARAVWSGAPACLATNIPISIGCADGSGIGVATLAIGIVAILVAGLSGFWTGVFPKRGHYMLPALGLIAALGIVWQIVGPDLTEMAKSINIAQAGAPKGKEPAFWPLVLGSVFFFYLWWLSALLFDLAFIWRRYTRASAVRMHLARLS